MCDAGGRTIVDRRRVRGAGLLACLLTAVPLVGGCGARAVPGTAVPVEPEETVGLGEIRVFDAPVLEEGVHRILTEEYYVAGVDDVRCPANEEVKVGRQFECEVVIEGTRRSVTITVRSEEGEYEVEPPA